MAPMTIRPPIPPTTPPMIFFAASDRPDEEPLDESLRPGAFVALADALDEDVLLDVWEADVGRVEVLTVVCTLDVVDWWVDEDILVEWVDEADEEELMLDDDETTEDEVDDATEELVEAGVLVDDAAALDVDRAVVSEADEPVLRAPLADAESADVVLWSELALLESLPSDASCLLIIQASAA